MQKSHILTESAFRPNIYSTLLPWVHFTYRSETMFWVLKLLVGANMAPRSPLEAPRPSKTGPKTLQNQIFHKCFDNFVMIFGDVVDIFVDAC